jgi:hypothetical protein
MIEMRSELLDAEVMERSKELLKMNDKKKRLKFIKLIWWRGLLLLVDNQGSHALFAAT